MKRLRLPGLSLGRTRSLDSDRIDGITLVLPITPRQLLDTSVSGRRHAHEVILRGVDQAKRMGAEVIGLGALTAPATQGGKVLAQRCKDVVITNGNAFTAYITQQALERLLQRCPAKPVVSVVGASGSVGTAVTKLLARHLRDAYPHAQLNLVARNKKRLEAVASGAAVQFDPQRVATFTDMRPVAQSDLVVLLTSSPDCLLRSEHLKHGAIVLDDTQPRNTDPRLLTERSDVTIVDGGLVQLENIKLGVDVGLPEGTTFACMAETMLLAATGAMEHFSIGKPRLEQVDEVAARAEGLAHYGFKVAPFHSFGCPLDAPLPDKVRQGETGLTLAA